MTLFLDFSQGPGATSAALANKVALPDLTLTPAARMITRIWANHVTTGTYAPDEPNLGYVIVTSENCHIAPLHIPLEPFAAHKTLGGGGCAPATKWVVNCECPGGTTLSFDSVQDEATAGHEVQVTVEFSDGGSPWPGGHVHMKCGEPAVTMSATDNAVVALTGIAIEGTALHMVGGYCIYETTLVADSGSANTFSITCDDFAVPGPFKSSFHPVFGGDANSAAPRAELTKIETDRTFRTPGKKTINCAVTARDAIATNPPLANWFVVYS